MGWFGPSKKKTLWKAAKDGNEAELRRLIELGGNVNWHNPEVRRRMCLAWAPASSSPLSSVPPPRPPDTAPYSPQPSCTARAVLAHTPLALEDGSCVRPGIRLNSSDGGLTVRARRVCPTPHRVRGDRQRHGRKSGAPSPKHITMGPLPYSHFVRVLSSVFRASAETQLCITRHGITRHGTATSRSPSASSKAAPMRRFETIAAGRPSTAHGRGATARSWPC